MIYRRFTEKAAEEWRQIYKALQLLEFLIKHGSERVIDDARSHLTLLKMLRQFHYIDQNGKDQGINVRNRAKELAELLGDVDRIRAERKKARGNKQKYTGVEGGNSFGGGFSGGSGSGSGSGSGGRYGGFGSETGGAPGGGGYGAYSGGVYGDGGGFGGQTDDWRGSQSRADKFEEYDEFDEGDKPSASRSHASPRAGVKRTTGGSSAAAKKTEPPPKKEPEVDLFSFDEPATSALPAPLAAPSNSSSLAALASTNDDDDFDDFQSATPAGPATSSFAQHLAPPTMTSASGAAQFAAPQPVSAPQQANLSNMVGMSSISPPPSNVTSPGANYSAFSFPLATGTASMSQPLKPTGYQPAGPNYFQSVPVPPAGQPAASGAAKPAVGGAGTAAKSNGGDAFGALWSQASTGLKKTAAPSSGPAMGQLAKEKSAASIWGAAASTSTAQKPTQGNTQQSSNGGAFGDLLG